MVEGLMETTNYSDWADRLTGQVHDMWFSVDDLRADGHGKLVIPLRHRSKDAPHACLVVPGVRAVRVFDSERVGLYDINYVLVNIPKRVLSIHGNIPIRVEVQADDPCAAHVEPI
jgi:hypothetical protein